MKPERIFEGQPLIDPAIAADCGSLAVGCSDVGGRIANVSTSLNQQLETLADVQRVAADLEADQAQVAHACEEAKILSAKAADNISASAAQIGATISDFTNLTSLMERLGNHVTNFAAAMEQVRMVSTSIETIAKTTNMLALNAAIEADRAGDAGRTFAVVASEVKKLASDTRAATTEIKRTVASLSGEAEELVREVHGGVAESHRAEQAFDDISRALSRAIDLVALVDGQSDQIARSATLIHGNSQQVRAALTNYGTKVRASTEMLGVAHTELFDLETLANRLFHGLVASGASEQDWHFVTYAQACRDKILALTEQALADGSLTVAQLFDKQLLPVKGTNPQLYRTTLSDWADANWRPVLDSIIASEARIVSAVCTTTEGFLPTHHSGCSHMPTGDPAYDTAHCRNGRVIMEGCDFPAKKSTEPFHLAVYRYDGAGTEGYQSCRNVYVPIFINGRRWGDFEVAYLV
jgi:methyl-accepting chemotaxis protein